MLFYKAGGGFTGRSCDIVREGTTENPHFNEEINSNFST